MIAVAVRAEAGHHLALALRDAVQIAESLQMLRAGVGDQSDGRPRDAHRVRRHRRCDSRPSRSRRCDATARDASSVTRHADVIVEIAVRRHARTHARQNRGGHFLGRGLAVAAGHRDDRQVEDRRASPAPALAARAACPARPSAAAPRQLRVRRWRRPRRAPRPRRQTSAPSKFGPRSATNSAPGLERAAVGRHLAVGPVLADQFVRRRTRAASRKVRFMPRPRDSAALRCDR